MLKTEKVIYNGTEYIRTWSNQDMMIERDGAMYEEAIDPINSGRVYTETDTPVPVEEANESDYLAALNRLGVAL